MAPDGEEEREWLPVAAPAFVGNEKRYVLECLESGWVSSIGRFIGEFEQRFAEFCGVKHAISCCNGTVALHLALLALGIKRGDEVIVPTFTFVATANAVTYCGATPIFVDCDAGYWGVTADRIEAKMTDRVKAVVVVHMYGQPCDMAPIREVADRYGVPVIEDAAQAHGARYKGEVTGSLGTLGTFSFYGNKILTSGEGGMVVTNHDDLAGAVRLLKGQGMDPARRYWFPILGYNYRMTNIEAAIGLAQLEKAAWHLQKREQVASWYRAGLEGVEGVSLQQEMDWGRSSHWMVSVLLGGGIDRDAVMHALLASGIETRPFFIPMHRLPIYESIIEDPFLNADSISRRGINLPSGASLDEKAVERVVDRLKRSLPSGS